MAERLYFKLWRSWWTGESHVEASADALAIGPVLMSFVRWSPGRDDGWAVDERDRAISTSAIARRAKWTTKRAADALAELVDLGTCGQRADGAWGFPKFGPFQETADAARKRRHRVPGHSAGLSAAIVEVEAEDELRPPTPASGARRRGRSEPTPRTASLLPDEPTASTPAESPVDRATADVLAYLNRVLAGLGEPGRFRDGQFIRARLAGGATEDELRLVIDARADECRRKPDALRHLNPKTPFRPGNWETALAHARAWRRTSRPSGPRLDVGPEELELRRQEAEAWDAKRREGAEHG
ncbi:MAG TPA: hypothetical protein VJP45_10425 [Candidatus Limnocylindria bacterium]|nr:hypothetical protein [Candidatus Limnocylindria bacterium]